MANKMVNCGDHRQRLSFSKSKRLYDLSNLLEIQKKSYQWFAEVGIKEVLDDLFPVENFSGTLSLEVGDYHFEEPRYSIKEAKERDATYSVPLKVQVRLFNHETGEVKEQEIFLGDMPMMTDSGSFVINGVERVVVSQLVRSPSVYYNKTVDSKSGRTLYTSQIIPNHGTWLEYEADSKDVLYVRIDRTRKVTLSTLLRAFGLSTNEDIVSLFGKDQHLENTLAKDTTRNLDEALIEIYEKLRPGEPSTLDSSKNHIITRFFDDFKYDLAKVGRYKFNRKLNVLDRVLGLTLAEDIKDGKKIVAKSGTVVTREVYDAIKPVFEKGFNLKEVKVNLELDSYNKIQTVDVINPKDGKTKVTIIGNDPNVTVKRLTIPDIYASVSYYLNLLDGFGNFDEIDHLGNRRIRQAGELLQNQFRIGVSRMERVVRERMTIQDINEVTPKGLINIRPITAAIKEFFGSSQLSQFLEQINPIAELTHKRRLSALGPGGLSRDRAGIEVRDVNESHYGRICPIESPEGQNIGLITSLASYARVDEHGFIQTPYRKIKNKKFTDQIDYLTADEEEDLVISLATVKLDDKGVMIEDLVPARYRGENIMISPDRVEYVDVSPQQVVSITTSAIPFLEHDDAVRALMGANMQRQSVPLLKAETPIVGTGVEHVAARDSGAVIISKADGIVEYVDARKIVVKTADGKDEYFMSNFELANAGNCKHQKPIVRVGDKVKRGEVIADGPSTDLGELALGKNVTIAFMNFDGYNYEDAVILNERLVKDDVYTSIHLENFEIECRETKLGPEEITRDIPNVSDEARKNLDANGIVVVGTEVKEGDILVGKVTPKGMVELTSEEKLLHAIFGEKTREVRDTSLRVPHGGDGIVHDVKVFSRENNDEMQAGITKIIRVYVAQKRKIQVGDKMAGRHGNKGVISLILPEEDMPFLPDGRSVDILLNPQGVPSRMNLGQILELHLGMAAKKQGLLIETPVFDGAEIEDVQAMMKKAGMEEDGKTILYDGRTGEPFDRNIAVGVMYMLKLHHMVEDKLHARATGPYSLVTQQPLGGKAMFGGQRFGEMEVWALEAYGAANILQEILTVKSDDVLGRVKVFESIVKGETINQAGVPESFRVLMKELQSLGLEISIVDKEGKEYGLKNIEEDEHKEDYHASFEDIEIPARKVEEEFVEEEMDFDDEQMFEEEIEGEE